MECSIILDLLSPYIDNEVTEEERELVEKHLSECPSCAEEYHILKSVLNELSLIEDRDLPAGFHEDLMNKIGVKKKRNILRFTRQAFPVAAAAFMLVLVIGVVGLSNLDRWAKGSKMEYATDSVKEEASLEPSLDNNQKSMADMAEAPEMMVEAPQAEYSAAAGGSSDQEVSSEESAPMMIAADTESAAESTEALEPADQDSKSMERQEETAIGEEGLSLDEVSINGTTIEEETIDGAAADQSLLGINDKLEAVDDKERGEYGSNKPFRTGGLILIGAGVLVLPLIILYIVLKKKIK